MVRSVYRIVASPGSALLVSCRSVGSFKEWSKHNDDGNNNKGAQTRDGGHRPQTTGHGPRVGTEERAGCSEPIKTEAATEIRQGAHQGTNGAVQKQWEFKTLHALPAVADSAAVLSGARPVCLCAHPVDGELGILGILGSLQQPGNETTGLGKRRNVESNCHLHLPVLPAPARCNDETSFQKSAPGRWRAVGRGP